MWFAERRLRSTEQTVFALRTRLSDQARDGERRRVATERIRSVLDGPGPEMVFQPIVSLADGAISGVEALARFRLEPQRTPDVWFAEAKEVGLGVELERVAARSALSCLDRLPQDVGMFVNLSPEAFVSPGFRELLACAPEDRLVVEVTEHAPVEDYAAVAEPIAQLRRRGGRLAIDDVGAGFASLRHIVRLGPDLMKLDIELTRNIDADRALRALAKGLIAFASEIGATIVAEGIETQHELDAFRSLGVSCGQGFFISRPQQLDALNLSEVSGRLRTLGMAS
jgi:EAL domain-containing protein (putative c-di-GMP-specific phosphodiesterase class I)